jgi:hypothetical protein
VVQKQQISNTTQQTNPSFIYVQPNNNQPSEKTLNKTTLRRCCPVLNLSAAQNARTRRTLLSKIERAKESKDTTINLRPEHNVVLSQSNNNKSKQQSTSAINSSAGGVVLFSLRSTERSHEENFPQQNRTRQGEQRHNNQPPSRAL